MWEPNLDALAAARPVIAWDLRGHGRSGAPADPGLYSEAACVEDMRALLDAVGIRRAALGGLSLGGYLSLAFVLAHPDRVAALLLFDTGPGFRRNDARTRWNESAEARAAALEREGLAALGDRGMALAGGADPRGLALAARGILAQRDGRVIDSLPSVEVPTLVLVGAADEPFLAAAEVMGGRIPGAVKEVIPDARHFSNLDQPERFNQAVIAFLDRLPDRHAAPPPAPAG
jgi:pimeloyl-ACP methyl ester carboxylesterase